MSESISIQPTATRYGVIAGLALVVLGLIFHLTEMIDYTGQTSNMIPNIINYAVMIGALVLAIQYQRDELQGGFITFGKIVGLGAVMGLIIGAISALWSYIFFTFIEPDFLSGIMDQIYESFEDQGMSEDQIEMAASMTEKMMSPIGMMVMGILGSVFMMTIFSLVAGFFMKRNPPEVV